jgi:nitrous oxidase accessory protein
MSPARPLMRKRLLAACAAGNLLLVLHVASATTRQISPAGDPLQATIDMAAPGDVLQLAAGVHRGPIRIDRPLTLEGEPGAIIDGEGRSSTVDVVAPGVALRHLTIRNSGIDEALDAGVALEQGADDAVVEDSKIEGNLIGVLVHGARDAVVRGNTIVGRTDLRVNERGNGVYVWNAPGAQVIGNDISGGRDGIFTNASRSDVFHANRIHGVRFAIHYMYTNDGEVSDNVSIGNDVGFAIMYSNNLIIRRNLSDGDRDHGLLLNYANNASIAENTIRHGQKCLFIYNANKNRLERNWFEGCVVGIHFTAGSERNVITNNSFVGNQTQVMYVGTRSLDWSENGRGNYWSDNPAFDLNGDGIADAAYRPNDIIDKVVWSQPTAKLLLNSPSVEVIRWAQAAFPALHPGGVIDSRPLMTPVVPPRPAAADMTQVAP